MVKPNLQQSIGFIFILGIILLIMWNIKRKDMVSTMDFPSFYSASKVIGNDNIYNYKNLDIGIPKQEDDIYPYIYPPTFAIFFKSITFLDYYPAENLWLILNCFFYLLLLFQLYKYGMLFKSSLSFSEKQYNVLFIIAFLSSTYLFRYILVLGQVDLFMVLLIFNSIIAYPNKKVVSAFLLAFALLLKPIQILLLFYFIIKKDYMYLLYFLIFSISILGTSVLFYGIEPWIDFLSFMKNYRETGYVEGLGGMNLPNYSLTNLIFRNVDSEFLFKILSYSSFFIVASVAAFRVTQKKTENILFAIAPLFFIQPLFSTVTWSQHMFYFFPIVFVLALSFIDKKYLSKLPFLLFFLTTFYWGKFVLMYEISNNIYAVTTFSMISLFVLSLFTKENK